MFHRVLLEINSFQFFYQDLLWRCCTLRVLWCWTTSHFCSLGWKLDGTKTWRCPFDSHFSSIFKIKILLKYQPDFFWKKFPKKWSGQNSVFCWNWFGVCSINPLCTSLTENIARRRRFLFNNWLTFERMFVCLYNNFVLNRFEPILRKLIANNIFLNLCHLTITCSLFRFIQKLSRTSLSSSFCSKTVYWVISNNNCLNSNSFHSWNFLVFFIGLKNFNLKRIALRP